MSEFDEETGAYKPRITKRRETRGDGITAHTVVLTETKFGPMTDGHTTEQRTAMRQANHESMQESAKENNAIFSDTLGHVCRHIEDSRRRILEQAGWKCENPEALLIDREWTDRDGNADNRPHAGPGWFAAEIDRILTTIGSRDHGQVDPLTTGLPMNLFDAGCLLTELSLRMAHNDYFMERQRETESKRDAGRGTAKATKDQKRDAYYRQLSINKRAGRTAAARRAATELGIDVAQIKRAFPDGLPFPPEK